MTHPPTQPLLQLISEYIDMSRASRPGDKEQDRALIAKWGEIAGECNRLAADRAATAPLSEKELQRIWQETEWCGNGADKAFAMARRVAAYLTAPDRAANSLAAALDEPTEAMLDAFQKAFVHQLHKRRHKPDLESAERAGLRAMLAVVERPSPVGVGREAEHGSAKRRHWIPVRFTERPAACDRGEGHQCCSEGCAQDEDERRSREGWAAFDEEGAEHGSVDSVERPGPPAAALGQIERDAARYQWLRHRVCGIRGVDNYPAFDFPRVPIPNSMDIMRGSVAQHLDAAIDAALPVPEPQLAATDCGPEHSTASIRKVIRELRSYSPAGDAYKGQHIHRLWADDLDRALAAVGAGAAELPEGWKLVPIEPTEDMLFSAEQSKPRGYRDLYAAMIAAAPLGAAAAEPWRPIETAPKDGSAIELGAKGGVWIGKYDPVYQSGYMPKNPWFSLMLNHGYMGGKCWNPTHWRPLPTPPALTIPEPSLTASGSRIEGTTELTDTAVLGAVAVDAAPQQNPDSVHQVGATPQAAAALGYGAGAKP